MTTQRLTYWTEENDDGTFCAGVTVAGVDYTSGAFATEAEADAEMHRMIAMVRGAAEAIGCKVTDAAVAEEVARG